MDKEKLLVMICQYVAFKENVQQAYYQYLHDKTEDNENYWHSLLIQDDDRWQKIVNYVYQED